MLGIDLLLLFLGAGLLWVGADNIVVGAAALARRLNISELVIGLTVVAMGTSAPEFLVTTMAAFQGQADLSLANVVGSNVFNLGLILGLMCFIKPLAVSRTIVQRDAPALLAATGLVLLFSWNGVMGRLEGLVLLTGLGLYLTLLLTRSRTQLPVEGVPAEMSRYGPPGDALRLALGLAAVAIGSRLLIDGATGLAQSLGVSDWVIGLTVVAAGTSLPELVTCLAAALRGKSDMLIGNLVGSDLFNFAGVLGLTCLLKPLDISEASRLNVVLAMGGVLLVMGLARSGWRLARAEGFVLAFAGLARWSLEFM